MSRIPRISTGGRMPRQSEFGLRKSSNIPRVSYSKLSRHSVRQDNTFKVQPTTTRLRDRRLPSEYQRHPVRLDSRNLEEIYNYTFKVAGTLFTPPYAQMFFPAALSTEKTLAAGHAAPSRSAAKAADCTKEVTQAFDFLNDMSLSKRDTLVLITDFVYLYTAIVVRVCSHEQCVTKALFFIRKFLDFDLPQRSPELYVLFSALMMTTSRSPVVIGILKQVVACLPNKEPKLLRKIQKGVNDSDSLTADICIGALQQINAKNGSPQTFAPAGFVDITSITDEKSAVSVLNAISENEEIPNSQQFSRDILITMQKFHTSFDVIGAASQCLLKHIEKCCPIEPNINGEILSVLFSTLNFSEGTGDSLDAKTAAQALIDAIFEHEESNALVAATKTAVNFMTDNAITLLQQKFSDMQYQAGEEQEVDAIVTEHKREKLEKSIKKLTNPDSIFNEMERVINEDDDISVYPTYLQGFLQRSYYLYKRVLPEGMPDNEVQVAKEMEKEYQSMKESNKIPEKYTPEALNSELESIQQNIHFF